MTFSPAELILLFALIGTSVCVLMMHRKLDSLNTTQGEYRRALLDSARALDEARLAVAALNRDGQNLVLSLCLKINEAETLLKAIDTPATQSGSTVVPIRSDLAGGRQRL
jgi:hypothetical protein